MTKFKFYTNLIISLLIIMFSGVFVACNDTDSFVPNIELKQSKVDLEVGYYINLQDYYTTNLAKENIVYKSSDTNIAKVFDDVLIAYSAGVVDVVISSADNSVCKTLIVNCFVRDVYANSIEVADEEINMFLDDSIDIKTLYKVSPSNINTLVEITVDNDNVIITDDVITAVSEGVANITIKAKKSATDYITKTISVVVERKITELDLGLSLSDLAGNEVEVVVDSLYYVLTVDNFRGLNINNIDLSDNIQIISKSVDNGVVEFVVKLLSSGDYVVEYNDLDNHFSGKIVNNFVHRNIDDYELILEADNNDIIKTEGVYKFLIGVDGVASPFVNMLKYKVMNLDTLISDTRITVVGNAVSIIGDTIHINQSGTCKVVVVCDGIKFETDIIVSKSYAKDFEISYPQDVYLPHGNVVDIVITPDYEYNYLPEDLNITCSTYGVEVKDRKLIIGKGVKSIVGCVVAGELRKEFSINVFDKVADRVEIYIDGVVVENNLIVITKSLTIVKFNFYLNGEKVDIITPLAVEVENSSIADAVQNGVTEYLYITRGVSGTTNLKILDYYGVTICNLVIVVENAI